jgi:predicted nuclease with TOPRIM domain
MFECFFPKNDLSGRVTELENNKKIDAKLLMEAQQRIKSLEDQSKLLEDQSKSLEEQLKLLETECKKLEDQYKILEKHIPSSKWVSTLASAAGAAAMGTLAIQHPGAQIPIQLLCKYFSNGS